MREATYTRRKGVRSMNLQEASRYGRAPAISGRVMSVKNTENRRKLRL